MYTFDSLAELLAFLSELDGDGLIITDEELLEDAIRALTDN